MNIYLIGSLRNPRVPVIANRLRADGFEVFDDWYAAGERADDAWQAYEQGKGNAISEALQGYAAKHVFEFDKTHLEKADAVVLLLPAGKSGHLELGWALGKGKLGCVLFEQEPERFDLMYLLASGVFTNVRTLTDFLWEHA